MRIGGKSDVGKSPLKENVFWHILALGLAYYPLVGALLSNFIKNFFAVPPLSAGFYGSLLILVLVCRNFQGMSTERIGVYTLPVILNGLMIGAFLYIEWVYSWQAMVRMSVQIIFPFV